MSIISAEIDKIKSEAEADVAAFETWVKTIVARFEAAKSQLASASTTASASAAPAASTTASAPAVPPAAAAQ